MDRPTRGRTDGQDEAASRFSHLLCYAKKCQIVYEIRTVRTDKFKQ